MKKGVHSHDGKTTRRLLGEFLGCAVVEEGGVLAAGVGGADFGDAVEGLGEVFDVGEALGGVLGEPDLGVGVGEEGVVDPVDGLGVVVEDGEVFVEGGLVGVARSNAAAVGFLARAEGVGDVEVVDVAFHFVDDGVFVALGGAVEVDEGPAGLGGRGGAADLAALLEASAVEFADRCRRTGGVLEDGQRPEQCGGLAVREAGAAEGRRNDGGVVALRQVDGR
mmetsp:Transcript_14013/g.42374  ORF Transcript_14013/g.42374 Transcript_14013/m.42374 type:complete len:222 (+) Transcript_14013:47-712(+)